MAVHVVGALVGPDADGAGLEQASRVTVETRMLRGSVRSPGPRGCDPVRAG